MRTLPSLAVVLIALVGLRAEEKIAAPAPKDTPPLSIDGKYTLLSVSTLADRMAPGRLAVPKGAAKGGAAGGIAPGARGVVSSALVLGGATITKNEITFDGRAAASPLASVGGPMTMEYTLDPTKSPAQIDVEIVNLRGKKSKSLGIVEVNGNHLIIALAKEGDERPKTTEEAEGVTVYYFQKAPLPPRTEFRIVAMTVGKEEAAEKELNKLAQDGFELVSTTQAVAVDAKSSVTTVHFLLKRTVKQP
jgi:uncharacterized protein (TIGR03067 family)